LAEVPIQEPGTRFGIVLALAVLTSFFAMNAVIMALTIGRAQSPAPFFPLVTADLLPYELWTFALLGLGIGVPLMLRRVLAALEWLPCLGRWMPQACPASCFPYDRHYDQNRLEGLHC
jgi:hypothetical protein